MKVKFTDASLDDMQRIEDYTLYQFGGRQLDMYITTLLRGIDVLIDHPRSGKPYPLLGEGIRGWRVEHHLVIYQIIGDVIMILRIVHERAQLDSLTVH